MTEPPDIATLLPTAAKIHARSPLTVEPSIHTTQNEDGGLAPFSGGLRRRHYPTGTSVVLVLSSTAAVVQNGLTIAYATQTRISRHVAVAATGSGSQMLTRALCDSRRNPPAHHRRHDPTLPLGAATKQYVDSILGSAGSAQDT